MMKVSSWVCVVALALSVRGAISQASELKSFDGVRAGSGTPASVVDPLLTAMQEELAREKAMLVLPGMQRPYFIQYRLEDIDSYEAAANYGALSSENETRQRVVRVEVRIGDYTVDSSSAKGDGTLELAPGDNDAAALKFALWTATDEAYKAALGAYSAKLAALKQFQSVPTANDFAPAEPITHIEPLRVMELDRDDWKQRLIEASGLYAKAPEVKSFADKVQYSAGERECAGGESLHGEYGWDRVARGLFGLLGFDWRGRAGGRWHAGGPQQRVYRGDRCGVGE